MRSSFVLTAVVLATAGPSLAAPAPAVPLTARSSDSTNPVDHESSEALKLPSLKNLGNIASIGLSGLGILGSLLPSDKQQQRDELVELLARSVYGRSINDLD